MIRRIFFLGSVVWVALNVSACGGGDGRSTVEPHVGGPEVSKASSNIEPAEKESSDTVIKTKSETETAPKTAPETVSKTKVESNTGLSGGWISGPSVMTPKIEAIVSALKAKKGQLFNVQKELAKYEKDMVTEDFKELPSEKFVQVVEVRKEHLMMAFVSVVDEGTTMPCDDDIPTVINDDCDSSEQIYALYLVRDERGRDRIAFRYFWDSDMKLFGNESPQVVFPKVAAHLPVVEVHSQVYSNRLGKVKVMEAYHVALQDTISGRVFLDLHDGSTGEDVYTGEKLIWIASKNPDRAYSVQVMFSSYSTFCTMDCDEEDAASPLNVQCERTTTVQVVTADKIFEPSEEEMAQLRKNEPGLAKLPPDIKGATEKECKKIRNFKLK